ncbi:MAG: polymerase protein [Candidatus Magasanikbacteria bacterium GW2011_GWA2_46_17]|uniref:DNA polymerase I n=1 Tax=Candidatus Magasanikbacteria bacterium GW2011_GWA2_46_17 TaxID=1619042 RepID=A0A0G1RXR5_9BACT|nr:MAG: polymerase protein [Candidatus Magasanikbacteria bacterium GW2011_GWA2_46_17]
MQKFIIVDGNAIIHRSYHALPPLTTREGIMVNAVYGFTSMLLKVWQDLKPEYIAVTFDVAGPTFRHVQYDKYKGKRIKADDELYQQIPLVYEVVRAFNIPIYTKQGYEADDVIGTIVDEIKNQKSKIPFQDGSASGEKNQIETFVVTGDMDTLQLVEDGVKVYTLRKGMADTMVYDENEVRERYGFGPEMVVDYKALRGDPSDNIPGVPGVGEKTATELIQKIGDIEEIYKQLDNSNSKLRKESKSGVIKKLEEGKESAFMSKRLAAIDRHVPGLGFALDDCLVKQYDKEKLLKLFQKFEFTSLLKRIPGKEKLAGAEGKAPKKRRAGGEDIKFTEIRDTKQIKEIINTVREMGTYSCRALLDTKDLFTAKINGLVVITDLQGYFLPTSQGPLKHLREIFDDSNIELLGHDLKELIKILKLNGVEIKNKIFDIKIASYLLNPGSRAHDVASVALKALGREIPEFGSAETLFGIDAKAIANTLFLINQTKNTLEQGLKNANNLGLFEKIEMPLISVLAEMELNGVAVDLEKLDELSEQLRNETAKVTKKIYRLAGQEFNISSPIQLREILFDKLQIPVESVKKGKTGLSTSAEELEKLRGLHPIIDEISEYRGLVKLANTYVDVLPTLMHPETKRIHTSFNQAVTATGRLSSSDPNLQNIPVRTALGREIRKAFVAEPDNVLVSADYSQIELRIVASLAQDERMIDIFNKGEDIHCATAAAIHGVLPEKVTLDMRRSAKEINFGILYGISAYGLSWRAGISREEAKAFIDKYFEQFSGIQKYIERTLEFTRSEGYCETLFGRRRYIPELNAANFQLRSAAERMAINHPIQGTAADLIKMAMTSVSAKLNKLFTVIPSEGRPKVKIILQVHDELVLEVKKGLEDEVEKMLKETMENIIKLRVPIVVDVRSGRNWGEIK